MSETDHIYVVRHKNNPNLYWCSGKNWVLGIENATRFVLSEDSVWYRVGTIEVCGQSPEASDIPEVGEDFFKSCELHMPDVGFKFQSDNPASPTYHTTDYGIGDQIKDIVEGNLRAWIYTMRCNPEYFKALMDDMVATGKVAASIHTLVENITMQYFDIKSWGLKHQNSILSNIVANYKKQLEGNRISEDIIEELQSIRKDLRSKKDFEVSDKIRSVLEKLGEKPQDTKV